MAVKANMRGIVPQTCGLGWIGLFGDVGEPVATIQHLGGCGFVVAGFTKEREACKPAYKELVKRYGQPVYQSPVRTNTRTGHKFFFAIWDTK